MSFSSLDYYWVTRHLSVFAQLKGNTQTDIQFVMKTPSPEHARAIVRQHNADLDRINTMKILRIKRVTMERCPCPYKNCSDMHLVGIGKFVQGSGFTEDEANLLLNLLNPVE